MEPDFDLSRLPPGEKIEAVRFDFQLDGVCALALCGQLQLSLRHPENKLESARMARRFVDHCISVFEHEGLPEVAQLIRLGYDPAFDGVV